MLSRLHLRMQRESPIHFGVQILGDYLKKAAQALQAIGDSLISGIPAEGCKEILAACEALTHRLRQETSSLSPSFLAAVANDARFQMDALNGQLRAALDLAASTRDTNNDGHNETAQVNVTAYEALDRNNDGFDELARGIEVSFAAVDANSNGFPERVDGRIYLYGRADPTSDGILEVRRAIEITALATDSNDDGHPELTRIVLTAAVVRDMNQDGIAEYRASLDGTLEAVDQNSNGIFEKATLTIRAEAFVDANSDGHPEDHSFATLDGVVLNTIEDQNPDRVELHLVATQALDFNSDGLVDETRGEQLGVDRRPALAEHDPAL